MGKFFSTPPSREKKFFFYVCRKKLEISIRDSGNVNVNVVVDVVVIVDRWSRADAVHDVVDTDGG